MSQAVIRHVLTGNVVSIAIAHVSAGSAIGRATLRATQLPRRGTRAGIVGLSRFFDGGGTAIVAGESRDFLMGEEPQS